MALGLTDDELYYLSGPPQVGTALQPVKSIGVGNKPGFDIIGTASAVGKGVGDIARTYYGSQGQIADAKLLAQGSTATQVANAGVNAGNLKLFVFGGLALAAIVMLAPSRGRR